MINFIISFDGSILIVTQFIDGYNKHELFSIPIYCKNDAEQAIEKLRSLFKELPTNYQVAIDEFSENKLKEMGIVFQPNSVYKQIKL